MNKQYTYQEYLESPQWRKKRIEILDRDNNQCKVCNSKSNCQVHHRQYHFNRKLNKMVAPWQYDNLYLIALCAACHKRGHEIFNVPTKYI